MSYHRLTKNFRKVRYFPSLAVILFFPMMMLSGCSNQSNARYRETSIDSRFIEPSTNSISQRLNSQYQRWKGTPYRYGGNSHKGVDCSGFVSITYKEIFNKKLPRVSSELTKLGKKVSKANLKPGDLVVFKTGGRGNGLHVGIYDKNGEFIHASTSQGVIRSSLNNQYWQQRYWQSRRILN